MLRASWGPYLVEDAKRNLEWNLCLRELEVTSLQPADDVRLEQQSIARLAAALMCARPSC